MNTKSRRNEPARVLSRRHPGDLILRAPVLGARQWSDTGRGIDSVQTAAVLGITHQAVSLLTRSALHKLKKGLAKIDKEEGGRLLGDPRAPKLIFLALAEICHERRTRA